jgi:hypothetical protein
MHQLSRLQQIGSEQASLISRSKSKSKNECIKNEGTSPRVPVSSPHAYAAPREVSTTDHVSEASATFINVHVFQSQNRKSY